MFNSHSLPELPARPGPWALQNDASLAFFGVFPFKCGDGNHFPMFFPPRIASSVTNSKR